METEKKAKQLELIARAMCYVQIGDPNASTVQPKTSRWKWYIEPAIRFMNTYPELFED